MTKQDLILKIVQETSIKQTLVKVVVQKFLDNIISSLKEGKTIELRNFGVFKVKLRKKKIARNPRTNEAIPLPERKKVVFKPGLMMKKIIK